MAFARDSAAVRSGTPTKKPTGCPLYQRSSASSRVLPCQGDVVGTCSVNTEPGTKRRSGSSVNSSSLIAPFSPWALVRRPTLSCVSFLEIGINHVNTNALAVGERCNEGTQGFRRATRTADDAPEV